MKYVYTHSYNGIVFYVGCGGKNRPTSKSRTEKWLEYVKVIGGNYDVNIISEHELKCEALVTEKQLIKALQPECNVQCKHDLKMVLPIRMEAALYYRIKQVSEQDNRNMSQWCRIAIEKEISRYEANNGITQPKDY